MPSVSISIRRFLLFILTFVNMMGFIKGVRDEEMKVNVSKNILMALLFCGACANCAANEEEGSLQEFVLDPMVVTALGFAANDLETPALVEVFDKKEIEDSGANNAYDVLEDSLGVSVQSYGFNGASMGTMTGKIIIRGAEDGTLVLVDGVPVNMDGRYNLEDIPSDAIEKIEVVKGGGSVLYGSEATGGVINIITKKKVNNKIKVAAGNFGKEQYDVTFGSGKFNLIAGLENRGRANDMKGVPAGKNPASENVYDYGKGERQSIRWNYLLDDGLTFTHNYSENEHKYLRRKANVKTYNQINDYKNRDNNFVLNYDKDGLKAYLSYGTQEKSYDKISISSSNQHTLIPRYNWRKGHNTNFKVQKSFELGKDKLLIGVDYNKEDMDTHSAGKNYPDYDGNLSRDNYSIFASYDCAIGEQANFIVNMRETWAQNSEGTQTEIISGKKSQTKNKNLSKFTPEAEYIYRITEDSSVYLKAGKSFRLPTLTQIYGSGNLRPALNLKPEDGTHYEIGYKHNQDKIAWRIAAFNYEIKDSVEAYEVKDGDVTTYDYKNKNIRNTGIELSCSMLHDNIWSSKWGVILQNPQAQDNAEYGDNKWHDYSGKYQINASLSYDKDKLSSTLKGNFVGDRTSDTGAQRYIKPQFFTDWHLSYKPEEKSKIFLHINNIFDRRDIVSTGDSDYYNLGRNFVLGYELAF